MPQLSVDQILDRLKEKLKRLEDGEELPNKDVRALLTQEQLQQLGQAWAEQEVLRKNQRARTDEQKKELGWKSKREVRIDIYRQAVLDAENGILDEFKIMMHKAEAKRSRIYLETYFKARDAGKEKYQAENEANAALTRAHLRRLDGVDMRVGTKRDKVVKVSQKVLENYLRTKLTNDELEQLEILDEHNKAQKKKNTNARGRL